MGLSYGLCYFLMFGSELRIYAQNFCHLHTVIVVVHMFSSLFSFLIAFLVVIGLMSQILLEGIS